MNATDETDAGVDSGYARLEQQIRWYDEKSMSAQRWYKRTKLIAFLLAATVPAAAMTEQHVTAVVGVLLVVIEGIQQLNQWQHNWITYRSTCEALRHEKYSYLGGSGAYDGLDAAAAKKTLVERVEGLVSTEHAKWQSRQEYAQQHQHAEQQKGGA